MYGVVMKEGYDWRVVMNAMKTYNETGKKTYVICHCGAPTKKQGFDKKRKNIAAAFKKWQQIFEGSRCQRVANCSHGSTTSRS